MNLNIIYKTLIVHSQHIIVDKILWIQRSEGNFSNFSFFDLYFYWKPLTEVNEGRQNPNKNFNFYRVWGSIEFSKTLGRGDSGPVCIAAIRIQQNYYYRIMRSLIPNLMSFSIKTGKLFWISYCLRRNPQYSMKQFWCSISLKYLGVEFTH